MPAGRPTDYDSTYCEQVIAWGKQGKSITWMASAIDVAKSSIYKWMEVHPEFSDAMARAKQHAQAYWEDLGEGGMTADKFNASIWSRSMAARFPEDWREKTATEHSGPNGGPMQVEEIRRTIIDPAPPVRPE